MATAPITKKRDRDEGRGSHLSKGAKGGAPKSGKAAKAKGPTLVDQPGRFGPWGGRYVPETLMAALEELEREYERAKKDPRFQGAAERAAENVCRTAYAVIFRAAAVRETWRRKDLFEARRPSAYRRPQDQQLHWSGAAG